MVEAITAVINGGFTVGVKISGIDLEAKIKKSLNDTEKLFSKEIQLHATKIIKNTNEGKTYDDKNLKKYRPSTKRQRLSEGLQVDPPNLTRTGALLKSVSSKTFRNQNDKVRGQIYIKSRPTPASKRANEKRMVNTITKARNVLKLGFNFFGMSRKQLNELKKKLKTNIIRKF